MRRAAESNRIHETDQPIISRPLAPASRSPVCVIESDVRSIGLTPLLRGLDEMKVEKTQFDAVLRELLKAPPEQQKQIKGKPRKAPRPADSIHPKEER